MDPDECLKQIDIRYEQEMRTDGNHESGMFVSALDAWLVAGGFSPKWADYPLGSEYFARMTDRIIHTTITVGRKRG